MAGTRLKVLLVSDLEATIGRVSSAVPDWPDIALQTVAESCSAPDGCDGGPPDAVLVDVTGGRTDALRRLAGRWPGAPVIALSGSDDPGFAGDCLSLGAQDILPLTPRGLARLGPVIEQAILRSQAAECAVVAESSGLTPVAGHPEEFRTLFEAAPALIVQIDLDGRLLAVNRQCHSLLGYRPEEVVGRRFQDLGIIAPEDAPTTLRLLAEAVDGRFLHDPFQLRLIHADGHPVEVEAAASGLHCAGRLTGILAVVHDIGARKQAEAERARLQAAIEQSDECVVITDAQGVIQYVNPAFERITGHSREEAIGAKPSVLKSGYHDEAFYCQLWRTITSGRTWHGQFVNRRKDGTLYQEVANISPIRDADGQIASFVAVKRDISQEVALEAQLRQAQKLEAVGELAGGIAHDFNNLLTGIGGYAQIAADQLPPDHPVVGELREISGFVDRAAAMTRQLLAFSRKQTLEPVPLNLDNLIGGVAKMIQRMIGEDIQLEVRGTEGLASVQADRSQIEQVLLNLAVNARDAMAGGGRLIIETANTSLDDEYARAHVGVTPGDYVMIAVSDTGCGMDAATRARIFEPFFTTKPVGRGTGLGLSTAYGIIRQHGGNIWVYSEVGRGTTFRVYLPMVAAQATDLQLKPESGEVPRGNENILLVEDEEAVRALVQRLLTHHGYTVLAADTPEEAMELFRCYYDRIDLLLTDVVMPGMNGKQLYNLLCRELPDLKVLYMSGYTDRAIACHGELDAGIVLLQKPFSPDGLARKVREALDGDRQRQAMSA
ncbi:MAG: Sensor histidine kinase RcsC [Phycisphaerae bacterium]|nr:Sensor histidine kinase RcsC [Phycisphaerae bacterium]